MPQPPEPRRGRGPQLDQVPQKGRTHGASGAPSDEDGDWDRNRDGIVTGSQKAQPKADQVAHLIAQEWGLPFFVLGDGYGQETVGSSGELHLYPLRHFIQSKTRVLYRFTAYGK